MITKINKLLAYDINGLYTPYNIEAYSVGDNLEYPNYIYNIIRISNDNNQTTLTYEYIFNERLIKDASNLQSAIQNLNYAADVYINYLRYDENLYNLIAYVKYDNIQKSIRRNKLTDGTVSLIFTLDIVMKSKCYCC
jgi:hypothetical protein